MAEIELTPTARVLLIRLSAIGDCLLTTPVAEALKGRYPQSRLTWVVEDRCRPMIEGNPFVDEILVWHKRAGAVGSSLTLLREVRRRRFEAVLDLQGLTKSSVLAQWSGAPHRIVGAQARPRAKKAATLIAARSANAIHAAEYFLACLTPLGIEPPPPVPRLFLTGAERAWARDWLADRLGSPLPPLLGLNPGASRDLNRWYPDRFAEVAVRCRRKWGLVPLLFGGPEDAPAAEAIARQVGPPLLNVAGRTTLRQLAALTALSAVFVTGDTGPMHIAAAMGAPVVALFGPADPERTGPVQDGAPVVRTHLPCQPCFKRPTCAGRRECMDGITVGAVVKAVGRQLTKGES